MAKNDKDKKKPEKEKIAFIIAPIGSEGETIRERIDGHLEVLYRPVLKELGYKVIAPHEIPRPGSITRQIIEHLLEDDLVLCDLTTLNPNVMYELAVRHGKNLPIVLVADEKGKDKIPFDISVERILFFKDTHLGVSKLKDQLKAAILSIESGEKFDNPISRVVGRDSIIQAAKASGDTVQEHILKRMTRLEELILDYQRPYGSGSTNAALTEFTEKIKKASTPAYRNVDIIATGPEDKIDNFLKDVHKFKCVITAAAPLKYKKGKVKVSVLVNNRNLLDAALETYLKAHNDLEFETNTPGEGLRLKHIRMQQLDL